MQGLVNPVLSGFMNVFDVLFSLEMFVLVFAFIYLFVNKTLGFKLGLAYGLTGVIGFATKYIVKRPRPFDLKPEIFAQRSAYKSYALPSLTVSNTVGVATFALENSKTKDIRGRKRVNPYLVCVAVLLCLACAFEKLYFAQNYLLDVLIGAVVGVLVYLLFAKISVKISPMWLIALVVPCGLILLLYKDVLSLDGNVEIFEYCGLLSAILLGCVAENKFIKYEIKHNIFVVLFKVFATLIVLVGYYFLAKLLVGPTILSFVKYFVAGLLVTVVLPLLFKGCEKFFYVFSNKVDRSKVVFSGISFGEKSTTKIAKKLSGIVRAGDVVLLSGDLGAGKTVLVRSLLPFYGVTNKITSPTFTLVNEYTGTLGHFYHFDMYRLKEEDEIKNLGYEEILGDNKSIKFIEWPELVPHYLPDSYYKVTVVKLGKKLRNYILEKY